MELTREQKADAVRKEMGWYKWQNHEAITCPRCKWSGTIIETHIKAHDSGIESWQRLAGRQGEHFHCPECDELVAKYYSVIS